MGTPQRSTNTSSSILQDIPVFNWLRNSLERNVIDFVATTRVFCGYKNVRKIQNDYILIDLKRLNIFVINFSFIFICSSSYDQCCREVQTNPDLVTCLGFVVNDAIGKYS